MHIRTKFDTANYLCQPSIGGDKVYKLYLTTEGYEENGRDLTRQSIPLFIIQSVVEVSECIFIRLKGIAHEFDGKKDVNISCDNSSVKIDVEFNVVLFREQMKLFHTQKHSELLSRVDTIFEVIDVGSEIKVFEQKNKRLKLSRSF